MADRSIAIGASAGAVDALRSIVAALPHTLSVPILVVLHVGAHSSELPKILSAAGPLFAKHAEDGETIHAGCIYVAPPPAMSV
jgi:two-component system chemotaxis response regulator CheB